MPNNDNKSHKGRTSWEGGVILCLSVSAAAIADDGAEVNIGGLLDQAAIACAEGDHKRLAGLDQQLGDIILAYPDLPQEQAYVRKLLADFRQGNCHLPEHSFPSMQEGGKRITQQATVRGDAVGEEGDTRIQFKAGYGSNINLGVRNDTVRLDSFPGQTGPVDATLSELHLPKEDAFTDVLINHEHQSGQMPALTVQGTYNQRDYRDNSAFSFKAAELGVRYQADNGGVYAIGHLRTWAGSELWQKSTQVNTAVPVPVTDGETSRLYWDIALNQDAYPKNPDYDAQVVRSGLRYQQAVSDSTLLQVKAEVAYNHAEDGQRPGGDRKSHGLSVAALKGFDNGWQTLLEVEAKRSFDAEPYSPSLYGSKKRVQTLGQAAVRLRKLLRKGVWLDISYLQNSQDDKNIPLFDAKTSHTGSIGVEYRW